MVNITILDSAFRNSHIIKETYGGVESPLKIVEMENLVVNNTLFS